MTLSTFEKKRKEITDFQFHIIETDYFGNKPKQEYSRYKTYRLHVRHSDYLQTIT